MTAPADRDQVLDRYTKHVNKSLASLARLVAVPVEVTAAGSKVQGSDGHTYLDCGGFGVFLLGHCHPVVVGAVREQLERNPLATRLFLNSELAQAAAGLARQTGNRDLERSRSALVDLTATCNRCHQTFRVPVRVGPDAAPPREGAERDAE